MKFEDLINRIKDENTFAKPCCVDGSPDAHTVWFKVGVQSFCFDDYQDTEPEADWIRNQIATAMAKLVLEYAEKKAE